MDIDFITLSKKNLTQKLQTKIEIEDWTLLFRGGCSYKHTKKIRITVAYKKIVFAKSVAAKNFNWKIIDVSLRQL